MESRDFFVQFICSRPLRYADNLAVTGKDKSTVCIVVQQALKINEKWCIENELSVNPAVKQEQCYSQGSVTIALRINRKCMGSFSLWLSISA